MSRKAGKQEFIERGERTFHISRYSKMPKALPFFFILLFLSCLSLSFHSFPQMVGCKKNGGGGGWSPWRQPSRHFWLYPLFSAFFFFCLPYWKIAYTLFFTIFYKFPLNKFGHIKTSCTSKMGKHKCAKKTFSFNEHVEKKHVKRNSLVKVAAKIKK